MLAGSYAGSGRFSLVEQREKIAVAVPETQSQGLLFFVAEVQVRTVMQHAFAEIERDIRYKSKSAIPLAISRRFMTLAGLLEIADREFQAIQEEDATLRAAGRTLIDEGRLDEVEVTADALHIY